MQLRNIVVYRVVRAACGRKREGEGEGGEKERERQTQSHVALRVNTNGLDGVLHVRILFAEVADDLGHGVEESPRLPTTRVPSFFFNFRKHGFRARAIERKNSLFISFADTNSQIPDGC